MLLVFLQQLDSGQTKFRRLGCLIPLPKHVPGRCRDLGGMSDSAGLQHVSPYAFEAMQKVDVVRLAALSDPELRLLLPCLVRMALCAPADQSQSWAQDKKLILRLLSGVEAVNSIVALLSVDFHALEQDARKEQQLR